MKKIKDFEFLRLGAMFALNKIIHKKKLYQENVPDMRTALFFSYMYILSYIVEKVSLFHYNTVFHSKMLPKLFFKIKRTNNVIVSSSMLCLCAFKIFGKGKFYILFYVIYLFFLFHLSALNPKNNSMRGCENLELD